MKQIKCICGFCEKPLPPDNVCREKGCWYAGAKQLNPSPIKEEK